MTLRLQGSRFVLKGGKIGQDKECCCVVGCTDIFATSGGVGTTVDTYEFPSTPEPLVFEYEAYSVPDAFTVKFCGNKVVDTGSVSGSRKICLEKPAGCTEVEVTVVGPEGTAWTYTIKCSECPPPPPPEPCCTKIAVCEDTQIGVFKCGGESEYNCCASNRADDGASQSQCSGDNPPITVCEPNGYSPSYHPPHDCLNERFRGGAWVTVSGWSAYTEEIADDGSQIVKDIIASIAYIEEKVNQTFFVPFDCFGYGQVTLDLGPGEAYETVDCSGANVFVTVSVNLCERTASVVSSHGGCYGVGSHPQINLGALSPIEVPCNSWSGCNCASFSGSIPVVNSTGGGTLSVSES